MKAAKIDGAFVVPGEPLGVVEQFLPGPGTYERDGTIYAVRTGYTSVDVRNKIVTVKPRTHVPNIPEEGSTVLGVVAFTHDKMATVQISQIDGKAVQNPFTGILHISSSSPRFVRHMGDVCKTADILRAKVIDVTNRVPLLTTAGHGLGVIQAYCSQCGGVLEFRNRKLECASCRNIERRRMAEDYGMAVPRGVIA